MVEAGGKRLRPAFCQWGFVGAGGDPDDERLVDAGAAFELMHAFALFHDDVMDDASSRRGEPTAWIYTIVRNAARDALRRRRAVPMAEVPDVPDADPASDPQQLASVGLDAFHLHSALMELPERSREVIELAYYQGLSQSEIAERIDVPLGTVKTRMTSGLRRLRAALEEQA